MRYGLASLLLSGLLAWSLPAYSAEIQELTWSQLIPADAPPELPDMTPIHDLSKLGKGLAEAAPAVKQKMRNAPVVKSLDGKQVRMPGYIVPLDVTDEGRVIDFLLVPYFGACIHVPPPPSNQIVHVTSKVGVKMDELYQPYWIEGPIAVKASASELANASYQIAASKIYPYQLPEED